MKTTTAIFDYDSVLIGYGFKRQDVKKADRELVKQSIYIKTDVGLYGDITVEVDEYHYEGDKELFVNVSYSDFGNGSEQIYTGTASSDSFLSELLVNLGLV